MAFERGLGECGEGAGLRGGVLGEGEGGGCAEGDEEKD